MSISENSVVNIERLLSQKNCSSSEAFNLNSIRGFWDRLKTALRPFVTSEKDDWLPQEILEDFIGKEVIECPGYTATSQGEKPTPTLVVRSYNSNYTQSEYRLQLHKITNHLNALRDYVCERSEDVHAIVLPIAENSVEAKVLKDAIDRYMIGALSNKSCQFTFAPEKSESESLEENSARYRPLRRTIRRAASASLNSN